MAGDGQDYKWVRDYNGDGTHDQKLLDRCRELRKWLDKTPPTDPSRQSQADSAKKWCDKNFPDDDGSGTPPATTDPAMGKMERDDNLAKLGIGIGIGSLILRMIPILIPAL